MIHHELKRLRQENKLTLKELSSKVGYGTGNLSSYETGKLKAKDPTLIRILTRGFGMSNRGAANYVAQMRRAELEETYKLELTEPKTIDDFLIREGFDKATIKKIKREIDSYRKS